MITAFFTPFQRFKDDLFRLLPLLYLVWSLPILFAIILIVPPGGQADEPEHFARAAHVAAGGALADKQGMLKVDPAISAVMLPFASGHFHPEIKATSAQFTTASSVRWSGSTADLFYPAAGKYPPFFYIPGAVAVYLGQALDLAVLQTFYLARSLNAVVAAFVTAAGLYFARRTRFALTAVAVLPMTMALYASTSQDALLIATSLLVAGMLDRIIDAERVATAAEMFAITVALSLIAMSRPSYVFLSAIVFVAAPGRGLRPWLACGGIILATAMWWTIAGRIGLSSRPGADTVAQISFLMAHPRHVLSVAYATLDTNLYVYWEQFIGVLGWLDVVLPHSFEHLVEGVLALSFISALADRSRFPLVVAIALITSIAALFGALYLSFTLVGADTVDTVQGRYFLPAAALLPLALPGIPVIGRYAQPLAAMALMLLMICSPAIVLQSLAWRHYLGAG
jgi:uncharacterized membrane protein